MGMRPYTKGTDRATQLALVRDAFSSAASAVWAGYDLDQAWLASAELGDLARELESEAGKLRARVAYSIMRAHGLTQRGLAEHLGVSSGRAGVLIRTGRQEGTIMREPSDRAEQPIVVLAVIATERGVLMEERADKIPPWTLPGGEMREGETPAQTVQRRVPAETGLRISAGDVLGRRVHPKTGRFMIYVQAEPQGPELDLALVEHRGSDRGPLGLHR